MQISQQKVVTMNYEVVDDQGQLIDRSEEDGPLAYIHGTGQLIPGLETALEGDVLVAGFPSAPMWGRGRSQSLAEAWDIEQLVTSEMADVCEALEYAGVAQGRRAMFVRPRELQVHSIDAGTWVLKFILPPGSYATTLLGEIATVRDLGGQRG